MDQRLLTSMNCQYKSQGTFSSPVEELVIVAVLVYCHSIHIVIVLLMSLNAFFGLCIFLGYNFTW